MRRSQSPSISVVIPVYGCVGCLEPLCERLESSLSSISDRYEIILVDDRSPDNAWAAIQVLQATHPAIVSIRLSRNFGQQIAISAGLAAALGDCVVVMDCDLQDPPEMIPELYAKLREGYDLVLARRRVRHHATFRSIASKAYFGMLGRLTQVSIDGSYGAFSILSRKVVDAYLRFGERERHYLFILRWLGFNAGSVEYVHSARTIGHSSYSLGRLLAHALDGMFFQATVLLRWIVLAGLIFSSLGLALAGFFVFNYFAHGSVPGFTSIVVLILICTGTILSSMGIIGLYVGKIFDQAKGRPLYIVDGVSKRRIQW